MVVDGADDESESVPAQHELNAFAEAVISRDDWLISESREALHGAIGNSALPDAAAIISHFDAINRVADGAGISLDSPMLPVTQPIIEQLGISHFEPENV